MHAFWGYTAVIGAVLVLLLPMVRAVDAWLDRVIDRHVRLALEPDEFDVWVEEALDLTREDFPAPRRGGAFPWR